MTCVVFSVAVIVFMIGPASSHVVLLYAACFEAAGVVWYFAAVRGRLRRGEAGPALAARLAREKGGAAAPGSQAGSRSGRQVALHRRGDGGHHVAGGQRGQRLQPQDVPAQGQAQQLRRDERAALGRVLLAQRRDRPR